ncbi:MAG: hypothetical protein RR288_02320 [Oscillibacter sp.]
MKKRWKIAGLAALLALICWAAWYGRPVSVLDLNPELEPVGISLFIERFGDTVQGNAHRDLNVDATAPEGQALLEQLEAIRIRRSPLNPLRKVLPSTGTGRQTQDGQYHYVIHVFGTDGWVALQFLIDEWSYDLPEQPQYLPCRVFDGEAIGQALGDKLWEMAQEIESNP